MSMNQAYKDTYLGEPAVFLKFGRYEAVLLPEVGANLIAFRDAENGYAFLHEPTQDEMEAFKARPFIHGIPVLFPPNRFEDGKFPWNGRTLTFPVNEPATGNHLHGFVHSETFTVEDFGTTATESYVVAALKVDEQSEVYKYMPFRFTLRLRYAISEQGLEQQFTVINDGEESLPCLYAFHTSVNAPFVPGNSAKDYRLKLTVGDRWHLNERMLPTGEFQPLSPNEQLMKGEGVYPFFEALDNHYTVQPQNGRNRMELTDTKAGLTLVYDAGTSYKQWMIWNNFATEGFFCPEPQISLVNAPNTQLPADDIGLFSLAPGEIWQERARIYVK